MENKNIGLIGAALVIFGSISTWMSISASVMITMSRIYSVSGLEIYQGLIALVFGLIAGVSTLALENRKRAYGFIASGAMALAAALHAVYVITKGKSRASEVVSGVEGASASISVNVGMVYG